MLLYRLRRGRLRALFVHIAAVADVFIYIHVTFRVLRVEAEQDSRDGPDQSDCLGEPTLKSAVCSGRWRHRRAYVRHARSRCNFSRSANESSSRLHLALLKHRGGVTSVDLP